MRDLLLDTAAPAGSAPDLDHVETWLFDLDNTLYPAACDLFAQVDRRMTEFIGRHLHLGWDEARALQKRYYREHGTTLHGLMHQHGLDPALFLEYVHDIDLTPLSPNPVLADTLKRLSGRKLVYTNGSAPHAERVLEKIGIANHFEAVVDIVAADYVPKPEPAAYEAVVSRFGIEPRAAAMIEDIARNLAPAHALGMTTVWLRTEDGWSAPADGARYIDHTIDDLTEWLAGVVAVR